MKNKVLLLSILILLIPVFISACGKPTLTIEPKNASPTTGSLVQTAVVNTPVEITAETPAASNTIDAAGLVQERCTVCHSMDRIISKKASIDGWSQTVERMISNGAVLDVKEKDAVIQYLATTYPE